MAKWDKPGTGSSGGQGQGLLMTITPPGPPGSTPPDIPDYDLHELSVLVYYLDQASRIFRANIRNLTNRVVQLENRVEQLESGNFHGDVHVDGTVRVKGDVVLEARDSGQ